MTMLARLLALALILVVAPGYAAPSPASTAPFLWQVRGKSATHYLLGSVHLLPQDAEYLPEGIANAYDAVDGIVFESDIAALASPQSALALLSAAKAEKGLRAEIDTPTYARLRERMTQLKMPRPLCEQYKAWFCALSLEIFEFQRAGFSGEYGLDRQVYDAGRADGKQLSWFETPDRHLALFADMSGSLSRQLLASVLDEDAVKGDDAKRIYRAWRDNDSATIEALVVQMKARYPEVYARLLQARNRAWLPKLKSLLQGEAPQMIVVGAAHWLGPDGLLAALKGEGYKPVPYIGSTTDMVTQLRPGLIRASRHPGARHP